MKEDKLEILLGAFESCQLDLNGMINYAGGTDGFDEFTETIKSYRTEFVLITKHEYDSLKADRDTLRALEVAGVDNWEGYPYGIGDNFEDIA